jgi:hypothetical protein
LKVFFELDEDDQPYLNGFLLCNQLDKLRQVRFYLDTGSTVTTLLDIDIVRLGLKWKNLGQTICITATGTAEPYVLPKATIYLKALIDDNGEEIKLKSFDLEKIHLMPPEDPSSIIPVQYEFGFSLLGLDILKMFKEIHLDWNNRKVVLER